jgi:hypothetical protein
MSDLTAIDILLNPDDRTLERARQVNEVMRRSVPEGFALDADHQPHVTTLQRFVRTTALDDVYTAVAHTIAETDLTTLTLKAVAIRHVDWGVPAQGLAVLFLEPVPTVLDFQARLLAAISPYVESGGTADAFVRDGTDPEISASTIAWVESYDPAQIGAKYTAHITVGFATLDDLKGIEARPFESFNVHPASIAVYHLGNNGTARRQLKRWSPAP